MNEFRPFLNQLCLVGANQTKCTHHGQVDVAGVHLHVDLLVDGSLVVLVKVLTDDGHLVVWCFSKVGKVNSNLVLVSVIALIESSRKHSGCRESDVN